MKHNKTYGKFKNYIKEIHGLRQHMEQLTDDELKGYTKVFQNRLLKGEPLDRLMVEAFAVICEADKRVLGKFPYDAQILGAIALHKGYLAEMNTGEGKTLVATMPLYLNALTGKSTILVTTNEYLALRDAKEMGQVYEFMGLTCMAGVKERAEDRFTNEEKKVIYNSDIVYTTHGVLGFDYLLNNLVTRAEDRFMRPFYYVIIDEADSVLLDSAQTPLVISGAPRVQSNYYKLADFFVSTLRPGVDYETEDKKVWLTKQGVKKAQQFFEIENFYDKGCFELHRHVILALRAHVLFEKERDYVVSEKNELVLLDSASGRMMPGVKLRGGQHQAIEMKEKIEVTRENRSVASITYQNLFRLFPKMSGMSGTIFDAAREIKDVYAEEILVIPPNHPVARKDYPDRYFKNAQIQFERAIEKVVELHKTGQPVLVVVTTIAETELVSSMLMKEGIAHNVLNANNAFWEAGMIKEAGVKNAVTVATSMAGRGTDIKLGDGVKELGGLAVIGIGRMCNVRQERQARGRAGRQGDPGCSLFFVSMEDEIVQQYGNTKGHMMRKKKRILNAQKCCEEVAVDSRKNAMDYDEVLQRQRELIYRTRDQVLDSKGYDSNMIMDVVKGNIQRFLETNPGKEQLKRYVLDHISYTMDDRFPEYESKDQWLSYLMILARKSFAMQKEKLGETYMVEFVREGVLTAVDQAWVEQVDYLQQLKSAVAGRALAGRNVIFEYQKDALLSYKKMAQQVYEDMMRNILLSDVYVDDSGKLQILLP